MKKAISDMFKNPMFWVAVIYLLVPVDILSDAIPVIGTLDDLIPFTISMIVQSRLALKR